MKTLILFTTRHGCTTKAAGLLQARMGQGTDAVNLMTDSVPELSEYETVILGGSIYYGGIQKQMTEFINKEQSRLASKKIGLFICAAEPEEKARKELEGAFPDVLRTRAAAADVFGDELDYSKLSLPERLIFRAVKGKSKKGKGLSLEKIDRFAAKMLM
ncbi:flavodoxin domain-containing protein [Paenibacillus sabinae]|uniref:Flavodoxin n=1 Tax=Paenibacillus sabinae T27 TaxID=1268072 RepID=X4ZK24_9BACL|nr:flavodoxin domain-containing protein [Paenibacillus sabinae]AHV97662.1 flavodoxin [Paenibacillus sabinae T27]